MLKIERQLCRKITNPVESRNKIFLCLFFFYKKSAITEKSKSSRSSDEK